VTSTESAARVRAHNRSAAVRFTYYDR